MNLQTAEEVLDTKAYTNVSQHPKNPIQTMKKTHYIDHVDQIKLVVGQLLALQILLYYDDLARESIHQMNMNHLILKASCRFIL